MNSGDYIKKMEVSVIYIIGLEENCLYIKALHLSTKQDTEEGELESVLSSCQFRKEWVKAVSRCEYKDGEISVKPVDLDLVHRVIDKIKSARHGE